MTPWRRSKEAPKPETPSSLVPRPGGDTQEDAPEERPSHQRPSPVRRVVLVTNLGQPVTTCLDNQIRTNQVSYEGAVAVTTDVLGEELKDIPTTSLGMEEAHEYEVSPWTSAVTLTNQELTESTTPSVEKNENEKVEKGNKDDIRQYCMMKKDTDEELCTGQLNMMSTGQVKDTWSDKRTTSSRYGER